MVRRMASVVSALVLCFALATPGAAREQPPDTFLRSGNERIQKGLQHSYCWDGVCVDYRPRWPDAKTMQTGKARIRIQYAKRPKGFGMTAYSSVDENGTPEGNGETIPKDLRPVKRHGETTAWDAVFRLDEVRHYYIFAAGSWKGADSSWTFHVTTKG